MGVVRIAALPTGLPSLWLLLLKGQELGTAGDFEFESDMAGGCMQELRIQKPVTPTGPLENYQDYGPIFFQQPSSIIFIEHTSSWFM